jgi:hypothetical protein
LTIAGKGKTATDGMHLHKLLLRGRISMDFTPTATFILYWTKSVFNGMYFCIWYQFVQKSGNGASRLIHNSTPSNSTSRWPDAVWYGITTLFFVIIVSVVGYSFIQQQKKFLLDEKQKELATIADMKSSQLVQWRKERFAEAASIRANAMMTHRIASYLAGIAVAEVHDEISRWMANLVDLGEYSKAVLFAPDGRIISSTTEPDHQLSQHYRSMITEAVENHELILSDFHSDREKIMTLTSLFRLCRSTEPVLVALLCCCWTSLRLSASIP